MRARGPEYKGCEKATPCKDSVWGCCEDLIHPAHGPNKEGCCLSSTFGCCQDNINEAKGPNFDGCSCEGSEFGCCPDDFSKARGPDHEGILYSKTQKVSSVNTTQQTTFRIIFNHISAFSPFIT